MLKNVNLTGYTLNPWKNDGAADEKAMTWIWNQLMGETAIGDTLDFSVLHKGHEMLYVGLLRDRDGKLKAVIPAMYERYENGVLNIIEVDGVTKEDDMDSLTPELKVGKLNVDWDEIGADFFK